MFSNDLANKLPKTLTVAFLSRIVLAGVAEEPGRGSGRATSQNLELLVNINLFPNLPSENGQNHDCKRMLDKEAPTSRPHDGNELG